MMTSSNHISALYWNYNGISGKRHQLELLLNYHNPDIFALSESKLISSITDREICSKYTLYRRDQNTVGREGGVLIGISEFRC